MIDSPVIDSASHPGKYGRVARRDDVRRRNDLLAGRASQLRFYPDTRLPLICECDSEACAEFVRVQPAAYTQARREGCYIVHPGHRIDATVIAHETAGRDFTLIRVAPPLAATG